jgi:hypothetical protein
VMLDASGVSRNAGPNPNIIRLIDINQSGQPHRP